MPFIGGRELREHTAEVLRQIREAQTEYIITQQGQPVALLLPLDMKKVEVTIVQATIEEGTTSWSQFAALSASLRQQWPKDIGTSELLDAIREERVGMLTIDASVYLNSFNQNELGSADFDLFFCPLTVWTLIYALFYTMPFVLVTPQFLRRYQN